MRGQVNSEKGDLSYQIQILNNKATMSNDYRIFRQEEETRLKAGKEGIYLKNMEVSN